MNNAVVKNIEPGSLAEKTRITPGDILRKINCNTINDVLDYEFYSYDSHLLMEFTCPDGRVRLINIRKPEGTDLGIEFESYLMDEERSCVNKCIFCFIDQLPEGMRETLYYKDDDIRLSFFHGNYITLTNLSDEDIARIIKLRISPINVSVHTLNPKLKTYMLGGTKSEKSIEALKKLAKANISLNCQIVCCPGINNGWELSKTIEGLIKLGPCVNSVSVVPVGLTKHRQGLTELRPFDKITARKTIRRVEHYAEKCLKKRGSRVFYNADELYITARMKLPDNEYYEDYPQLENGVGMMRLFITEFEIASERFVKSYIHENKSEKIKTQKVSIITGSSAYKYIKNLFDTLPEIFEKPAVSVYTVQNDFFGESVTVSGLITGGDIIRQLQGKELGDKLLIPQNMLRKQASGSKSATGDEVFLDDVMVSDLSEALKIPVCIVAQDGTDLFNAFLNIGG